MGGIDAPSLHWSVATARSVTAVDAVADYLLNHDANTHWEYPTSRETDVALAGALAALAARHKLSAREGGGKGKAQTALEEK